MSRTTLRPALAALALLTTVLVTLVAPAGAAQAASSYRFWGYFQLSGTTWQFAPKGADQVTPADGSVEGWRFAVAGPSDTRMPRVTTTFDEVCADTSAKPDTKRVAVVIDYGRSADQEDGKETLAPVARCASVPTAATGAEVLAAVATVRADKAMICGIDGRPATGCGDEVKAVSPEAAAPDTSTTLPPRTSAATATPTTPAADSADGNGSSALTWAGIGVVVLALVALGAVAMRRRGQHGG